MILKRLPKITRIEGGESPVNSPEFTFENYSVTAFLFENAEGKSLTVKVKANKEGGTAETVPFLLAAAGSTEYETVKAGQVRELFSSCGGSVPLRYDDYMLSRIEGDLDERSVVGVLHRY